MGQKPAELGSRGLWLFVQTGTCLTSACFDRYCCSRVVVSRAHVSVSSGRRPGGAQHTCSLAGQVFAGASVPCGSSIVFVSRAFVPLVTFAQVTCGIGAREVISRKLLGKFAFAAEMYYLVRKVFVLGKGGFPSGWWGGRCWQCRVRMCPWKKCGGCLLWAEREVITKAFAPSGHGRRALECSWQSRTPQDASAAGLGGSPAPLLSPARTPKLLT